MSPGELAANLAGLALVVALGVFYFRARAWARRTHQAARPVPRPPPLENRLKLVSLVLILPFIGFLMMNLVSDLQPSKLVSTAFFTAGLLGGVVAGIAAGMEKVRLRKHRASSAPSSEDPRSRWLK